MIFQKRGKWCYRDENGRLHKFVTEAEALAFTSEAPVELEIEDATEEEVYSEEETYTYEQETLFESEIGSEETF